MEEIDKIVLSSLTECGCDFAEDINTLGQLSTEQLVEAVVRCLRIINPDFKLSHIFPPGMSARFRIGTSLAQACRSVGYNDDIGYQTFLYSSEAKIRKLFMFLVEKMPRTKDDTKKASGNTSHHWITLASTIKEQLMTSWVPWYCSKEAVGIFKNQGSIIGACEEFSFQACNLGWPQDGKVWNNPSYRELLENSFGELSCDVEQIVGQDYIFQSLMEANVSECSLQQEWEHTFNGAILAPDKLPMTYEEWKPDQHLETRHSLNYRIASIAEVTLFDEFDQFVEQLVIGETSDIFPTTECHVAEKFNQANYQDVASYGVLMNFSRRDRKTCASMNQKSMTIGELKNMSGEHKISEEDKVRQTREILLYKYEKSIDERDKIDDKIHFCQESVRNMVEELNGLDQINMTTQAKVKIQKRTLLILSDTEENLAKLKIIIKDSRHGLQTLEQQWEIKEQSLKEKCDFLNQKLSQHETQSNQRMNEMKFVRQRVKENAEELRRKEQLECQLTRQSDKVDKDIVRKLYTKRIHEITANIAKQKDEIERVIIEMRTLQKEVNQLEGRAERTFAAADGLLYTDAPIDENAKQAYKYLLSFHINCSQLLKTLEKSGEIMREMKNLEEQVSSESKMNTATNLEKISDDYKTLKKANVSLMKKLKSLSSSSPKMRS